MSNPKRPTKTCRSCGCTIRVNPGSYWENATNCPRCDQPFSQQEPWKPIEITSGLGIGGYGSDDYNVRTEVDQAGYEYNRSDFNENSIVCPAGTTQGRRGADDDRCSHPGCYQSADWNSSAGRLFCPRHWDEY